MHSRIGREEGQQIILVSLMLPILLVFVGLVIDVGNLYFHRRTAQNAADAAAVAGSIQLSIDATASATALAYAAQNGYSNGGSNTVTVEIKDGCVTVGITEQVRPLLVSLIWNGTFAVFAEAVGCMIDVVPPPVLLLSPPEKPRENDVLHINKSSKLEITHGKFHPSSFHANSQGDTVIKMDGNASRLITKVPATISGSDYTSESDKNFEPAAPITNEPVQPDPLKDLPVPPCSTSNPPKLEVSNKQSVDPGCYEKIVIKNGATVFFRPGIYYVETDFEVNKNARVTGDRVMFYIEDGNVTIEGKQFNVTPMTSGDYAGIIFFSARSSEKQYTFGGEFGGIEGIIYAANSEIEIWKSGKTEMHANLWVRKLTLADNGVTLIITGYEISKWSTRDFRMTK